MNWFAITIIALSLIHVIDNIVANLCNKRNAKARPPFLSITTSDD